MNDNNPESAPPKLDVTILPRDALVALWTEFHGSPPPPRLSQTFLRRFLAFELQAQTSGALLQSARTRIANIATGKSSVTKSVLKTGARYETALPVSSQFCLTTPPARLKLDSCNITLITSEKAGA